jgi:hypothetical protein
VSGVVLTRWQNWIVWPLMIFEVLLLVFVSFFSRKIGVNRFSLHGVYRNRLARAFLGSAHDRREPHWFTGFDSGDNCRMWQLAIPGVQPGSKGEGVIPRRVLFPIVNTALNMTSSERLAWQERKAMSFTISPTACGSAELHPETDKYHLSHQKRSDPCAHRLGAYVPCKSFGGDEFDKDQKGIGLASAITISGAAASPNMGYNSTPATAFLMTLFNVRLGAWLANPAIPQPKLWQRSEPTTALWPMISELSGQSDERGAYVYLSDAGHFENLGIYEMVRRRCKFIVVSDAGCDPACSFKDLGNAVRKISIDMNIDVTFECIQIAERDKVVAETLAYALGTIHYSKDAKGKILYIKPTYLAELPVDVRAYGVANSLFPHESTGDQFFSESQFESYRRLGFYLMSGVGRDGAYTGENPLGDFFRDVERKLSNLKNGVRVVPSAPVPANPGGPRSALVHGGRRTECCPGSLIFRRRGRSPGVRGRASG